MVVDDLFSVIHAAVTDLDCITIKDFPKFVVFREVLVYKGKESGSDIGADIFAEGSCTRVCCSIVCFFILLVVGGS